MAPLSIPCILSLCDCCSMRACTTQVVSASQIAATCVASASWITVVQWAFASIMAAAHTALASLVASLAQAAPCSSVDWRIWGHCCWSPWGSVPWGWAGGGPVPQEIRAYEAQWPWWGQLSHWDTLWQNGGRKTVLRLYGEWAWWVSETLALWWRGSPVKAKVSTGLPRVSMSQTGSSGWEFCMGSRPTFRPLGLTYLIPTLQELMHFQLAEAPKGTPAWHAINHGADLIIAGEGNVLGIFI